jgi:hypothetical protein
MPAMRWWGCGVRGARHRDTAGAARGYVDTSQHNTDLPAHLRFVYRHYLLPQTKSMDILRAATLSIFCDARDWMVVSGG